MADSMNDILHPGADKVGCAEIFPVLARKARLYLGQPNSPDNRKTPANRQQEQKRSSPP